MSTQMHSPVVATGQGQAVRSSSSQPKSTPPWPGCRPRPGPGPTPSRSLSASKAPAGNGSSTRARLVRRAGTLGKVICPSSPTHPKVGPSPGNNRQGKEHRPTGEGEAKGGCRRGRRIGTSTAHAGRPVAEILDDQAGLSDAADDDRASLQPPPPECGSPLLLSEAA
jgi:hypothetical protein